MLAVIYPAASLLATYLMSVGRAHHYDSHLLVYSGKPLSNKRISKIMALTTLEYLGIGLGLRDVRQLMCTILVNISRCNFGVPDEEDRELMEIHRLSNHSAKTAESRYALQIEDALSDVSQTAVASMQRVSMRWHATIGVLHPARFEQLCSMQVTISLSCLSSCCKLMICISPILLIQTTGFARWMSWSNP